jgi:hypothetical protein
VGGEVEDWLALAARTLRVLVPAAAAWSHPYAATTDETPLRTDGTFGIRECSF